MLHVVKQLFLLPHLQVSEWPMESTLCQLMVKNLQILVMRNNEEFSFSSGLSGVKSQQKKYLIIGGGKTGIDAVLYLLDHGVDPDRLMWVIPNDAWFLNRKFDTEEEIYNFVRTQIESTLYEEDDTWQKVLLR